MRHVSERACVANRHTGRAGRMGWGGMDAYVYAHARVMCPKARANLCDVFHYVTFLFDYVMSCFVVVW